MFKKGLLNVLEFLDPSVPTSPISHLLTSNRTPTDEELVAAENALATARQRRAVLSKSVHDAPASPDNNKDSIWHRRQRKIRVIDDFIQRLESRISPSPVFRLPVELLQEIFRVVADILGIEKYGEIGIQKKIRLPRIRIPWAISWVCQLWRGVSVSMPYLWRALPVVSLTPLVGTRRKHLPIFQELLHRSQGCTIEVTIRSCGIRLRPCLSHPSIKLLIDQRNRWSYLTVMDDDDDRVEDIIYEIMSVEGGFPLLRTLYINSHPYQRPSQARFNLLKAAPSLEYVSIRNVPVQFGSSTSRIRELAYEGGNTPLHIEQCIQAVYDASVTLTDLCLSLKERGHMHLGTFYLPNLRRLEFNSGNGTSNWFIDHLVAPSLNRLTLKSSFQNDDLCNMASNMIHRSNSSNICELSISQKYPLTALITLLSGTPFLRYLNIGLPQYDDILELCKQHDGEFLLVPFLCSCTFYAHKDVLTQAIKPLQLMASSRFASSIPMPSNSALNGNPAPSYLEGLTIKFTGWLDLHSVSSIQCALQDWPESEKSKNLETENARITSILSDLKSAYIERPNLRLNRTQKEELDVILRRILNTKIDAIGDILHTDIRYTLAKISYCYKCQTKYLFPQLADQILQNWDLICDANIAGVRWQRTESSSLQYVQAGKILPRRDGSQTKPYLRKWLTCALISFL